MARVLHHRHGARRARVGHRDPRQFISGLDSLYYLVPNEPVAQEAFAVIRDAMRDKDMVALARVVLAKRERVPVIFAYRVLI
jgi:non-homologous end joining protein Ku